MTTSGLKITVWVKLCWRGKAIPQGPIHSHQSTRRPTTAKSVADPADLASHSTAETLLQRFLDVRRTTESLGSALEPEDFVVQSAEFVSPLKWHLAHTTWFYETFILKVFDESYGEFHADFSFLFNSYYEQMGEFHPRPRRGLLSRPTVSEVLAYRKHVDERLSQFLLEASSSEMTEVMNRVRLGLEHEQQHQELFLMDLKHIFLQNPLRPVYRPGVWDSPQKLEAIQWVRFPEGQREVGANDTSFCYDNELPKHLVYVGEFDLANRLVTEAEYLEFIQDGGYRNPKWWLSDGWAELQQTGRALPYGWQERGEGLEVMTLRGWREIRPDVPVCHVNYFEAAAFAEWKGCRLPTEFEWEIAAGAQVKRGNFLETGSFHPQPLDSSVSVGIDGVYDVGIHQLFGDVWEWTQSAYLPYPGYQALPGALGEYNGKFMVNQMVLRGGSCFSPADHIRHSYRNFFAPHMQWQVSGIRLAKNVIRDS